MDLLIAMNTQNSFLSPSGTVYIGEKAEILKVRLKDYISSFNGKKLFCREIHSKEDKLFLGEKTHSIPTTSDVLIIDELKPFINFVVEKYAYNAFHESKLDVNLKREKPSKIFLVGVETHTSILFTAEELRNRGYDVVVVEPCMMSLDDHMHNFAVSLMKNYLGVEVE